MQADQRPQVREGHAKDYWVGRTRLDGTVGECTSLTPFDNWAQMDAGGGEAAGGSAAAYKQYLAKVAECADSAEAVVVRYLPELSYRKPQ